MVNHIESQEQTRNLAKDSKKIFIESAPECCFSVSNMIGFDGELSIESKIDDHPAKTNSDSNIDNIWIEQTSKL